MNLIFDRVHLHNFMSFEDAEVALKSNGFVQIVGENHCVFDNAKSNGSGKSAIFEALNWCLTGETLRGSKDVVRQGCEDGTLVELEFSLDNDKYKITRTKNHKKFKTNLFIVKNGNDISGKGIRDTEVILKQTLPYITSQLINSVVVLGQGLPLRFTNNTPSGRKEVLESLSNSDFMIVDLRTRIANRKNDLTLAKDLVNNKLISLKTFESIYSTNLSQLQSKLKSLNDIDVHVLKEEIINFNKEIERCENEMFSLEHKNGPIRDYIEKLNSEKFDLANLKSSESNKIGIPYDREYNDLSEKIMNLSTEIRSKESEIAKLKSIRDTCPTCGQKIPDVHKVDTTDLENEVKSLKEKLSEETQKRSKVSDDRSAALKNQSDEYDKLIREKDIKISEAKKDLEKFLDYQVTVNQYTDKIRKNQLELDTRQNDIDGTKQEIEKLESQIKEAKDSSNEAQEEFDLIEKKISIQSKFENSLKRDFRGILLQNCIDYINDRAKEYCQTIFGTSLIDFALDGNNISITYQNKEYESLSGGEKQKIDLIVQFALRDMMCAYLNFSCNLLVLDELTDAMDAIGCKNTIDFIASEFDDVDSVFIISHRMDLEIPYDKILTVNKNAEGISSVL